MKIFTKEWVKDIEFHDLILMLEKNTGIRIPFIFMNGGTECVAKEDLYTVKTDLNVTDKENEIKFVMLPNTIDLELNFLDINNKINEETCKNDFLLQYLNRLRSISYLPENILKHIKDKRLLALGYADTQTKKEILDYIKIKYNKAIDLYDKCCEDSVKAEKGLTIRKQLEQHLYSSVPLMFDDVEITKAEYINNELFLTLDDYETVVLSGTEIIEEETDIKNSIVKHIELYKQETCYELHLLVIKRDENFIESYYYATYRFKDLKFME